MPQLLQWPFFQQTTLTYNVVQCCDFCNIVERQTSNNDTTKHHYNIVYNFAANFLGVTTYIWNVVTTKRHAAATLSH